MLDAHSDLARAEFVDTLSRAHEHDLEFLAVRIVVDILCKFLVDHVILDWNVDSDSRLEIDNVRFQVLDFCE